MSSFTNKTKHSSSFTNRTKHPSGLTFGDMPMSILENMTFEDIALDDGTIIADVTFDTPIPGGAILNDYITDSWTNREKH